MSKIIARKAFTGLEGHIRVGQVLDSADYASLTPARIEQLSRNGLVEDYHDKMDAAPSNKALERRPAADPPGMTSPNRGGITDLGWKPGAGADDHADAGRFVGSEGNQVEDAAGNGSGPAPSDAAGPDGSSTAPIGSESLSPPARQQKAPAKSSGGRPRRGNRS